MLRRRSRRQAGAPYGGRRAFVHLAAAGALALPFGAVALGQQQAPSAAATPASAAEEDLHILALGDSLTAGFGLPRHQGFVPQLEAYLRRQGVKARITNGGVSGDTAAQGRQRLGWTLDGLDRQPRLAIVALGANDMLRGLPPEETRRELDAIMAELKRRNIRILVAGMISAPNLGPDYAARFNAIFPDLAKAYGATLFPFLLDGVAGQRALNQADGIHPNFAGVKTMVMKIAPSVVQAAGR